MNEELVRQFIKRQPFIPFSFHLNDGRSLQVTHPDFVLLPPGWNMAIVCYPDQRFDFVYLRNVASIASEGQIPMPQRKRRRGDEPEA
jgi:hypothetical protein